MSVTNTQRALLDRARDEGHPLDPELPGDAATLLRAEALVQTGMSGSQALAQARREHAVFCEVCKQAKPSLRRADLPGLAWPVCGHKPVHVEREASFEAFLGGRGA